MLAFGLHAVLLLLIVLLVVHMKKLKRRINAVFRKSDMSATSPIR